MPGDNLKPSRDLRDIENIGEFAFAMCAMGLVLAIVAFVGAFFFLHLIGDAKRSHLILLTTAFWVALNVPVYRSLKRKTERWVGERRATRQILYVEICSTAILAAFSLLPADTIGVPELVNFLRYLFSSWILCLLGYQVFLHFILGYRIFTRDAVRWCLMGGFAIYSLFAKSF